MKKKTIVIVATVLVLAIAVAAAAIGISRSELGAGLQAFEILSQCIQSPSLSMELSVSARLTDASVNFTALVERSQWEGHSITTVTADGSTLCYTGGVILPENGRAYRLTEQYPDYSRLLEQILPLYENVQLESQDGSFTVTAGGADADKLLATLLPGLDAEAESLSVELITDGQQLEQIRTIDKCRIDNYLGKVTPREMVAIEKALSISLAMEQLKKQTGSAAHKYRKNPKE